MNGVKDGWFIEKSKLWPGQAMTLEVEEVLYHERSKYQDVMVFKSKTYGNVLVLDGAIQCTERDEFSYQEMITHLPLNCHPNPKNVLVIGGGDGGVIREVVKHPRVEKVTQCEIDEKVIEVSKKYLPYMSSGFDSDKLDQHIGDGFAFMEKHKNEFDVIITDSSDPEGSRKCPLGEPKQVFAEDDEFGTLQWRSQDSKTGGARHVPGLTKPGENRRKPQNSSKQANGPAEALFEQPYYKLMKEALKPGGIICTQGECVWLHLDLIKDMHKFCRQLYKVVDYAYCTIPTYPSGQIGFMLCSTSPDTNFREPIHKWTNEEKEKLKLRYYNADVHRASFTLPEFARKVHLRLDKKVQESATFSTYWNLNCSKKETYQALQEDVED